MATSKWPSCPTGGGSKRSGCAQATGKLAADPGQETPAFEEVVRCLRQDHKRCVKRYEPTEIGGQLGSELDIQRPAKRWDAAKVRRGRMSTAAVPEFSCSINAVGLRTGTGSYIGSMAPARLIGAICS